MKEREHQGFCYTKDSQYIDKVKVQQVLAWAKEKMVVDKFPRIVVFVNELPNTGSGET
jgi:acyl-CoA synthetase (AMP-forming)/AMP-acid ligase II